MNNSKIQTPTEKLLAEKNRVKQLLQKQETTLNGHITYIQANAGSLLLTFVSSMLFSPSKKDGQAKTTNAEGENAGTASEPLSFADFLPLTKLMLPVAWDIARPILMAWGIKKAKVWASKLFTRKKSVV